jgi:hypothetical protein
MTSPTKAPKRSNDITRAINLIEELSWVLRTYSDVDTKTLSNLRNFLVHAPTRQHEQFASYLPENSNVFFLVGTLPKLFSDERLFPTNVDIADFADAALKVRIPRWQKKSKFELIGHIVCRTAELSESQVSDLVKALQKIISNGDSARKLIRDRKQAGLSWNEIIQQLSGRTLL